jgi:hypothetical protein
MDANLMFPFYQHPKLHVAYKILIGLLLTLINSMRMGVLPAMTTISTSALLLYTGASTQNILLNFAAISIVTELDDQFLEVSMWLTPRAQDARDPIRTPPHPLI